MKPAATLAERPAYRWWVVEVAIADRDTATPIPAWTEAVAPAKMVSE